MKALIFTVTAGEGHNAIARAVGNELQSRGVEVKILDIYKNQKHKKILGWLVHNGYFTLLKIAMGFCNLVYRQKLKRKVSKRHHNIVKTAAFWESKFFDRQIALFKPDVIFSTHTIPAAYMDYLKEVQGFETPTFAVLFDFCVHPYWDTTIYNDYIVTQSEELHDKLATRGYKKSQMLAYGVPAATKFSIQLDQKEVRRELALDPDMPTVMIMFGGIGFGDPAKLIKELDELPTVFQIINVCGRNEKNKVKVDKLIEKGLRKRVYNVGFATNVDVLMSASDIMIGKIGGASLSESLNKCLPIVVVSKLAEQELANREYMLQHDAIVSVESFSEIPAALEKIMSDSSRIDVLRKNIEKIRKPNATCDLCDKMIEVAKKKSE